MSDREAFLRRIITEPDDDTHRLVYADWLDEHGEPRRAGFIRYQVANPDRGGRIYGSESVWVGDECLFVVPAGVWGVGVTRGFVSDLAIRLNGFLRDGPPLFREHPITSVWFGPTWKRRERLVSEPYPLERGGRLRRTRRYGWQRGTRRNVFSGPEIAHALWDQLDGFLTDEFALGGPAIPLPYRWYPTPDDAQAALSRAAVGFCRQKVGLPPLRSPTPSA